MIMDDKIEELKELYNQYEILENTMKEISEEIARYEEHHIFSSERIEKLRQKRYDIWDQLDALPDKIIELEKFIALNTPIIMLEELFRLFYFLMMMEHQLVMVVKKQKY